MGLREAWTMRNTNARNAFRSRSIGVETNFPSTCVWGDRGIVATLNSLKASNNFSRGRTDVVDHSDQPSDSTNPQDDPTDAAGRSSHFETADSSTPSSASASEQIPDRIGPYQIKQRIGAGGMGVVYLALQEDGRFRRRVAVKLLKRGMDSEDVLSRWSTLFWQWRLLLRRWKPLLLGPCFA